jgi:capsular exopolysaccharide synthesis family protein
MAIEEDPVVPSRFRRNSMNSPDESAPVEKASIGVPLARLIKRTLVDAPEIAMLHKPRSVESERFRRLKTTLINESEVEPQVIVITSPSPSEGKSLISVNLALAFAADLQGEVLLVDADLRRPTIEEWLLPPPKLGLSELLRGETELEHTVLTLENAPLHVLPAGSLPRDPSELLSSERAKALMADLRKRYQRIIIDTPPIVPFTDADAVGAMSDGVLLVVRVDQTRRSAFTQAVASVTSTRILGTVLNDARPNLADRGRYAGYEKSYYEYYDKDRKR